MQQPDRKDAKKAAIENVVEGLALLEDAYGKCSKGKAFFGGDEIGYLDIAFGSLLRWLRETKKTTGVKLIDEAKIPNLWKWAKKFSTHLVVRDVLPETDKLVEFAKIIQARLRAAAAAATP